jgi:phosphopantetheinyl transferase
MQAVDDQTLILYHTDLRGQWPHTAARAFAARLPYVRRLAARAEHAAARASLAGIALALRALTRLRGHAVAAAELAFAGQQKPRLATQSADAFAAEFSISHCEPWVGCAAMTQARVGFDIETGLDARIADWVVREALLKATGEGLRALAAVRTVGIDTQPVCWRGSQWHLTRPACFEGAAACIASSAPAAAFERSAVALDELFNP